MLKLSDAIRLGAMWRPQTFGRLLYQGKSCAIGAAIEACGLSVTLTGGRLAIVRDALERLQDLYPILLIKPEGAGACPKVGEYPCDRLDRPYAFRNVAEAIFHLNDDHHCTREEIADWVATVEPAEVIKPSTLFDELEWR